MAFSFIEFLRGALVAWVGVVAISPLVTVLVAMLVKGRDRNVIPEANDFFFAIVTSVSASMLFYFWFASIALVVAGIPSAWLLGRALRRTTSTAVHASAFAVLGALIGAATTLTFDSSSNMWTAWVGDIPLYTNTIVTALVVLASWSVAVKWARGDDAQQARLDD